MPPLPIYAVLTYLCNAYLFMQLHEASPWSAYIFKIQVQEALTFLKYKSMKRLHFFKYAFLMCYISCEPFRFQLLFAWRWLPKRFGKTKLSPYICGVVCNLGPRHIASYWSDKVQLPSSGVELNGPLLSGPKPDSCAYYLSTWIFILLPSFDISII